jgi:hypothetical protein
VTAFRAFVDSGISADAPCGFCRHDMDALNPSVARTLRLTSANQANRSDRNERIGVPNITGTLRQQALDEMLASIREYRAASPAFRPYWRKLAMHDIARFRRDYLQPERAAFEAAVAASKLRRAA